MRHGLIVVVTAACMLAGCAPWHQMTDQEAERLVGAEPLDGKYNSMTRDDISGTTVTINGTSTTVTADMRQNWVGAAAVDSLQKCQAFAARLAVGENSSDLALDLATLTLAGISAITLPARSAHALAAAAGITAGSRAAIDADLFAKNAAPIIVQQLNKTYFTSMNNYLMAFPPQSVVPGIEYAKIQNIHNSCSLELALASLGTGTQGTGTQTTPISSGDFPTTVASYPLYFKTTGGLIYQITAPADATGNVSVKIYQSGAAAAAITAVTPSTFPLTTLLQMLNSSGAVKATTG
jgi:hypothetical protein